MFDNDLALATGLQAGNVYIARYERYTMKISLNNQFFFENDEDSKCGLKTMSDPANGNFISMKRGYSEVSQNDNAVILESYLLHVLSDLSGKNLNIYFPCKPAQIEWKGTLYNF